MISAEELRTTKYMTTITHKHITGSIDHNNWTRRERLKSALYLRLKKRKKIFWEKLKLIEKFFLSENVAKSRKM